MYMTPNRAKEIVARDEEKAIAAFDPYDILTGSYPYEEYLVAINYLAKIDYAREQLKKKKEKRLLSSFI